MDGESQDPAYQTLKSAAVPARWKNRYIDSAA
jgi:hypothetical protein